MNLIHRPLGSSRIKQKLGVFHIVLAGLICGSCAGLAQRPTLEDTFPLPSDLAPTETAKFGMESSVIRILDSAFWEHNLRYATEREVFRQHADQFIETHPSLWRRAMVGQSWARDSARCAGEVWRTHGDVRWPYFVRFGAPSAWWVTDYQADLPGGGVDTTLAYFYWWDIPDTGLAAVAESSNTWPSKILFATDTRDEAAKAIYPVIDAVSFPNRDGTFDVWVTAAAWGAELTRATLTAGKLQAKLSLLNENPSEQKRLQQTLTQSRDLGLAGLVLAVTVNKKSLSIPFYFELTGLREGRYTLEASLSGEHNNAGASEKTLILPSPYASDGTSDMLLVYRRGPQGPGIAPRVHREKRELQGRAVPNLTVGDTISPYVEMFLPPGENWAYSTAVYLKRVQAGARGIVNVSPPVITADSLGEPLYHWAGVDLTKEMRKLERSPGASNPGLDLLFAQVYQPADGQAIFESSFEISPRVRPGDYWLIIDFDGRDRVGREIHRSVRKRISVALSGFGS